MVWTYDAYDRRKCYIQKWKRNGQEEDPEPNQKGYKKIGENWEEIKKKKIGRGRIKDDQRFLCNSRPKLLETT